MNDISLNSLVKDMDNVSLSLDYVKLVKFLETNNKLPEDERLTTEQVDVLLSDKVFNDNTNKSISESVLNIFNRHGLLSKENDYSNLLSLFSECTKTMFYIVDELMENDIVSHLKKTDGRFLVDLIDNNQGEVLKSIFDRDKELIYSKIDPAKRKFSENGLTILSYVLQKEENPSPCDFDLLSDLIKRDPSIKDISVGKDGEPYLLINSFKFGDKYRNFGVNYNLLRLLKSLDESINPDYSILYKGQNMFNVLSLYFTDQIHGNTELIDYMKSKGIGKGIDDNAIISHVKPHRFDLKKMNQDDFDYIHKYFSCKDSLRELDYMKEQIENKILTDNIKNIEHSISKAFRL